MYFSFHSLPHKLNRMTLFLHRCYLCLRKVSSLHAICFLVDNALPSAASTSRTTMLHNVLNNFRNTFKTLLGGEFLKIFFMIYFSFDSPLVNPSRLLSMELITSGQAITTISACCCFEESTYYSLIVIINVSALYPSLNLPYFPSITPSASPQSPPLP